MKVLLCTIPLDIGIPREVRKDPALLLKATANLPIMPKMAVVSLINWM